MSKIVLHDLTDLTNEITAVNNINDNNTSIETAFDNTLSRDGTSPNQMESNLDMNNFRVLNLPLAVSTVEPVTLGQMNTALAAHGSIATGTTTVPVSSFMQPVVASTNLASAQSQLHIPTPYIDATLYGVVADGVTDCSAALQSAINAANGQMVQLPVGTIVLKSQVNWITTTLFAPGLRLTGFGPEVTIIDNQVINNSCIYAAGGTNAFQFGGYIGNFSIKTTTSPSNSNGIEHLACYQYVVENLKIKGLTGDGCRVTANLGDSDASNEMWYRNCFITNCNIGINCNYATNVVQPSFMRVDNCDIQGCTIGWRFIGLQGTIINSGFAICTQYGLYIVNNGGSNAQFTSIATTFENNAVAARIDALQGGSFIQTELASGAASTPVSTQAIAMTGSVGIRFADTRVRISSTPHTLWTLNSGANGNIISNSFYQNYDNAGQTRYSINGFAQSNRIDDSFDGVQVGLTNGVTGISCINGSNENVSLPLTGAVLNISGPTGAFNIGGFANGFDGRRLTLLNTSAQVLTLNHEDVASTAGNRIRMDNGASVTVNPNGNVVFVYSVGNQRWYLIGKG